MTAASSPALLVTTLTRIAADEVDALSLRDATINASGGTALAQALKGNRNLTSLDLYNSAIGEGGMEALAIVMYDGQGRVTTLDVGSNELSLSGAMSLACLIRTERLTGPTGQWSGEADDFGPPMQVVHDLRLSRNYFDKQACEALVSADLSAGLGREQPLLLTLRSLALSFNPLGDGGARALGLALDRCPELHTLQLCGCEIGEEGGEVLASRLHAARSLTHLDLGSNALADGGARALASALPHSRVAELLLSSNRVGDGGACALALSLIRRKNSQLRTLGLSNNVISDDGAAALAEAISAPPPQRCRLETLSLRTNRLGPAAVAALGDAVVSNKCVAAPPPRATAPRSSSRNPPPLSRAHSRAHRSPLTARPLSPHRRRYLLALDVRGNKHVDASAQLAFDNMLSQNARERQRRVSGAPKTLPVQPNAAAKKLLRAHAQDLYGFDVGGRGVVERGAEEQMALLEMRADEMGSLRRNLEELRFAQTEASGNVAQLQAKADALERALAEARSTA